MNSKIYIRFTDDIQSDIERGNSKDIHGNKLTGLCAWGTSYFYNNGRYENFNGETVDFSEIKKQAKSILDNTYGSYSSNESASILVGTYVGSGNDGVLLSNVEEIDTIYF